MTVQSELTVVSSYSTRPFELTTGHKAISLLNIRVRLDEEQPLSNVSIRCQPVQVVSPAEPEPATSDGQPHETAT